MPQLSDVMIALKKYLQNRLSRRRDRIVRIREGSKRLCIDQPVWNAPTVPTITIVGKAADAILRTKRGVAHTRALELVEVDGKLLVYGHVEVMFDLGDPDSLDQIGRLLAGVYGAELGELTTAPTAATKGEGN